MLIDGGLQLDWQHAITSSTTSNGVGGQGYIQFNEASNDPSNTMYRAYPNPGYLVVLVTTTFAGGTSLDIQFQSARDSAFSTNLITHYDTGAVATANLTAGTAWIYPLPTNLQEFVRMNYVVVGTMTAGAVSAFIVEDARISEFTGNLSGQ